VLTRITEGLHAIAIPHTMLGLHLGTRMTVVTLPDGSLLVHSPITPTPALRAAVDALGEVSTIVAPNLYHHVYAGAFKDAYPKAKLVGPRALARKRPDLRFDAYFGDPGALPASVTTVHVPSMLDENVLYVPHLRSLVCADLTENFDEAAVTHLPTRLYLKGSGILGTPGVPRPLRAIFRDRRGCRRAIDEILGLDFDRVTLAHERVVEAGGPRIVRASYEWLRG